MTRAAVPGDSGALRYIWKSSFDDTDGEISDFFESFGERVSSVIAIGADGNAVAAGHAAAVGELVSPGGDRLPCAMLYAIAALPEARGRGHGGEVTRALTLTAGELGYPAVVLRPGGESLFEYYRRRAGFCDWFYARELACSAHDLPRAHNARLRRLAPREYRAARERQLTGTAHIDADESALEYQRRLCERSGGGMFEITLGGATACAVAEYAPDGTLITRELLALEGDPALFASALLAALPAPSVTARCPARRGDGTRFGMIHTSLAPPPPHISNWYGPAFD